MKQNSTYWKAIVFGAIAIGGSNNASNAQTTYLNPGSEELLLVDRIETKSGTFSEVVAPASQPMSRKQMVDYLSAINRDARVGRTNTSNIDAFNINRAIGISGEWYENASGESGFVASKRPVLKYFYKNQADFLNIETDDFFLSVNPVLYIQGGYEMNEGSRITNTRGLELRGRISDKIGFYTMLADNQERLPGYVQRWSDRHRGQMPGNHLAVNNAGNFDVFLARGYIDFGIIKDRVSVTFGYDKNQIGYGIRSLVYANNTAPSTFLRFRAKWKKFSYESLILEQISNFPKGLGDVLYPQKYAAIHQLNYSVNGKLNIGIFESSVLDRTKGIPLDAFIPLIGLQSIIKQASASASNNAWGLQFKAIPIKDVQVYGQAFLDKLDLGSIGKGSWKNQYGLQFGLKYFDVATLKNLDGQIEVNAVRPFTYTAISDSVSSFTHYNQPMAHPLGNNFIEFIGNLRYQLVAKLNIEGRLIYSMQGLSNNGNAMGLGNSIYDIANQRAFTADNAYPFLNGQKRSTLFGNLNVAYELRPNLFLEAGGTLLNHLENPASIPGTLYFYGGLRMNIGRTLYDFY